MIIYFTGTGNSKYIAKLISKKQNDSLTNASKLIKSGENPSFASQKPYVFIAPTYAWRMPRVFGEWIKKCSFEGNKKAYFILTCGDSMGAAGNYIKKFAADAGFEYMGTAEIVMPENYLVMFELTKEEDDAKIIKAATVQALKLCDLISAEKSFDKQKISFVGHLESGIVNSCFYHFSVSAKKFYATDACIHCGKCVDSCMLNNITLKDGKPAWSNNCTHCMACICKCPSKAIEYGKRTKGRRRYLCPKD